MTTSETIQSLKSLFPTLSETTCCGQTTLDLRKEDLKSALRHLKEGIHPGYEVLMDLMGVDYLFPEAHTKVIYLLHNPTNFQRISLRVSVKREEMLPSVTDIWEGADWYERELFDLFGVHFEGHPDMKRILMPDDWHGHPLRRDYPLTEEPVEFKHGVKPKVPSRIIPYVQCNEKN